jgi:type III pantothenate kinase
MILCLDAGNTRLKWGLFDPASGWQAFGALALTELDGLELPKADRAVFTNVASQAVTERVTNALAGMPLLRVTAQAELCEIGRASCRERVS